jgi:asparagine synthase (glutamine-hydrolysing)
VERMTGGAGKRALAAAPSAPLPRCHVERAKTGFWVPTDQWLAKTSHAPAHGPLTKGLASRAWGLELFAAHWAPAA